MGEARAAGAPEVQSAKNVISALLTELQVRRVIFVDDSFEIVDSAAAAIGWFDEALTISETATAALLPEINFSLPERAWAEDFRNVWAVLDEQRRDGIVTTLSAILGRYIGKDLELAGELRHLFPRRFTPDELGPSEWEERRDDLLGTALAEGRVLCLFDQDLSQAPGYTARGTRSGIGLMKAVLDRYADEDNIICGVLSHTFTADQEMVEWRNFASENGLELRRFLPISKERIREPLSFAAALKKTTLNLHCERLKAEAIGILAFATGDAIHAFSCMDVYDFDDVILRSSLDQGVPEAETLLRIYHVFHQEAVKRVMLEPSRASRFQQAVRHARGLSSIGDTVREDRRVQRGELRHKEMYEDPDMVNKFHAPLQTGDLFRLEDDQYPSLILVAQPCDLMVRSDGFRGKQGEDRVADLIPITRITRLEHERNKKNTSVRAALPYIYNGSDDVGIVEFASAHVIRLDVLDLSVLQSTGECKLELDKVPGEPPPQFHEAWRRRREHLIKLFSERAGSIERLMPSVQAVTDPELRASLVEAVMPAVTLGKLRLSTPVYADAVFRFGLHRVGRLREPWSIDLLTKYMRFRSRTAEMHDFVDLK